MKNTEEKKYFLKDNALTSVDDDFFRHQDVTNNIIKILETTKSPYNIAVIGKWGLGKSSLINMVSKHIESDSKHYMKIEINAWKYEKEVLAKVFLRQVKQGLFDDEKSQTSLDQFKQTVLDIAHEVKNVIVHPFASIKKTFSKEDNFWIKYFFIALVYLLVSFMLYAIYKIIDFNLVSSMPSNIGSCIGTIATGYARNMGEIVCGPLLLILLTRIYEESKANKNSFELKVPALGVEDYEIYLEREIEKKLKSLPVVDRDNFKIIIILDDLDRLSVSKMVEALDAIKMFINFKNCIFIVPYDDAILKNAIKLKRLNPADDIDIQSELLLDKLFQYKVYLPQLLTSDIKKYSVQLCESQIPDFVKDYMNNNWELFNDVVRHILIHNEIETPRQVKKIVNAFVSNMMIARGRQNAGNTEPNFATKRESINMIAKISVLQADFNEFYDLLYIVDNAIELSLNAYQGKIDTNSLPNELKRYFGITSKNISFSKNTLPLMNFLLSTVRYQVDSIYPYLYMAMDDISIKTGSRRQQEFRKILLSRNTVAAREQLKELPELINVGAYILNDENDLSDIANTFFTIIAVFDMIQIKANLIKSIAKVCDEVVAWINEDEEDSLDYNNMMSIYNLSENEDKQELNKLLLFCLTSSNSNRIIEKTEVFVSHHKNFDSELSQSFQVYINNILSNRLISSKKFISIMTKNSLEYNEKWSMTYYLYLIDTLSEYGDLSEENVVQLEEIYKFIAKPDTANAVFGKLESLFGVISLSDFFLRLLELEVSKSIEIETISNLIKNQLETEGKLDEDDIEINKLLLNVKYIIDKDNSSIYDNYIKKYCQNDKFAQLIINYCRKNDISLISSSIEEFTKFLFGNISSESEKVFRQIIDSLNESQLESVKKKLDTEMTYSGSKSIYPDIGNIIEIFSNDNERFEQIMPVFSNKISYMNLYSITSEYLNFMLDIFSRVIQYFDDLNRGKLLETVIRKANSGQLTDVGINMICKMGIYFSDSDYKKIVHVLCEKTTEQSCISVFYLMENNWKTISETKDYNDYIRIALMVMKNERYINDIIQRIGKHFSGIQYSTLKNFITNILESENVDYNSTINICAKFIDNLEIQQISKLFFELIEEFEPEDNIARMFSTCNKNTVQAITEHIIAISGEYELKDIMNLLDCLISFDVKDMNRNLMELASIIVHRIKTEDENIQLCSILMKITKEQYRGFSKQYVPVFTTLFEKTSSLEVKQRLVDEAKLLRIFKDVKARLSNEKSQIEWMNYTK